MRYVGVLTALLLFFQQEGRCVAPSREADILIVRDGLPAYKSTQLTDNIHYGTVSIAQRSQEDLKILSVDHCLTNANWLCFYRIVYSSCWEQGFLLNNVNVGFYIVFIIIHPWNLITPLLN